MVRHLTCARAPGPPLNEPQATQAIIWIIVMPISWVYTQDFVLGSLLAAIGLAMLVYVPYATWISLRSRHTSFDCAAREVAYTFISMTTWLATAIWICSFLNTSYHCMDWTKAGDEWIGRQCYTHAALAAIGFFQAVISATWLAMIVWIVHRIPEAPSRAYQISVAVLLRGGLGGKRESDDQIIEMESPRDLATPQEPQSCTFIQCPPYRVEQEGATMARYHPPVAAFEYCEPIRPLPKVPESAQKEKRLPDMKSEIIEGSF